MGQLFHIGHRRGRLMAVIVAMGMIAPMVVVVGMVVAMIVAVVLSVVVVVMMAHGVSPFLLRSYGLVHKPDGVFWQLFRAPRSYRRRVRLRPRGTFPRLTKAGGPPTLSLLSRFLT
jgi:hypothetical protein